MHYVSVCPSCIVSRVALADVSGHGRAVAALSVKLGELMHTHLTALEQACLMRDLNDAVLTDLDGVHYATMVAVGFHACRGLLVMTNAGHPPAFGYRPNRREWSWFDSTPAGKGLHVSGTPLGLLPNVSYNRTIIKPDPGDLIVLYSDVSPRRGSRTPPSSAATISSPRPGRWIHVLLRRSVFSCLKRSAPFGKNEHPKTTRRSSCCKRFQNQLGLI